MTRRWLPLVSVVARPSEKELVYIVWVVYLENPPPKQRRLNATSKKTCCATINQAVLAPNTLSMLTPNSYRYQKGAVFVELAVFYTEYLVRIGCCLYFLVLYQYCLFTTRYKKRTATHDCVAAAHPSCCAPPHTNSSNNNNNKAHIQSNLWTTQLIPHPRFHDRAARLQPGLP